MSYKDIPDTNTLEIKSDLEEDKPIIEYVDFSKSTNKLEEIEINDNNNDNDTLEKENAVDITNLSENGGILYEIIRYFDDLYVTGRTHIENNYFNFSSNEDFNLVYPNIYVGNYSITTNFELLKGLGITHIISVIPTFNPAFEEHFKYLHIQAYDDDAQDMKMYFTSTNKFIKDCLAQNGKVLIHCMVGHSRSVTIFLAFLISIIKGEFSQSIVKFYENECNNDTNITNESSTICNMFEYKKLLENNKNHNKNKIVSGMFLHY